MDKSYIGQLLYTLEERMITMSVYGWIVLIVGAILSIACFVLLILMFNIKKFLHDELTRDDAGYARLFSASKIEWAIVNAEGAVRCRYIDRKRAEWCLEEYYDDTHSIIELQPMKIDWDADCEDLPGEIWCDCPECRKRYQERVTKRINK